MNASPKTTFTDREAKILSAYKDHVETFLETHVLETTTIKNDYRLIPLTLEFISAASEDICLLSGKPTLSLEIVTFASIWLLTYIRFECPHNMELLIKTFMDIPAKKYSYTYVPSENDVPKKRRHFSVFGANTKLRFSTIKQRWTRRDPNGCLPTSN
jgi:hypothetical protein